MNNGFHGKVPLKDLPQTLRTLDLAINMFSGEIVVSDLPESTRSINIFQNDFSGTIEIRKVRPSLIVRASAPVWVIFPDNPLVDKEKYCNKSLKAIN